MNAAIVTRGSVRGLNILAALGLGPEWRAIAIGDATGGMNLDRVVVFDEPDMRSEQERAWWQVLKRV